MKNTDLDAVLRKASVPQPPEEFWIELPQQVARQTNRSRSGRTEGVHPAHHRLTRLSWGLATAVCIVIAFSIGHWKGQKELEANSKDVLANPQFVRETLAAFPGQVRAIVEDEHGLNVVLSDTDDVPVSTPLYVRISRGKEVVAVVTFSGQEIQIAGQKMTVLSDAQGGIILMGTDFAWSSGGPAMAKNDWKITAKNLELNTM